MQTLQTLNINGRQHTVAIDNSEMLVDVLRDKLGLTGAKKGCNSA
jgi:xanthine dehydrogenase YagT iron-sulfur-binding subunit